MSATLPAAAATRRIGRFELLGMLGRGAQATVWRAHDPRLQRDVALKCLDPVAGGAAFGEWLREARAVSRLSHPHIVPVFEADEHDGIAYLVFELVAGSTLAQRSSPRAPVDAQHAVPLMLGVLEALEVAHRSGIVHRDLKPSNVLVDAEGRARVMDFGIAARLQDGADGMIVGTPGYMSPEAARGEAAAAAMDVFAAGAVLGELLCGHGMLWPGGVADWVRRVQAEDLHLPPLGAADDTLRAIVHRALARDPALRYPSARALHAALQGWMQPAAARSAAAAGAVSTHGTLEFLLRRMRRRSDFPALSASVLRIQRLASSDSESLGSLCAEILKDVALTNKLLRMVNTARYGPDGGGGIGTISRAVSLVGFAGIRNMALSLLLLEQMHDRDHAELLTLEFLRALMAGTLAGELAGQRHDREQVFLGAMLQGLGRLLTEYYLPEEAHQIRCLLPPATAGVDGWRRREAVAMQILGLGFEELGIGVARSWGLPEVLLRGMCRPEGDAPARAAEGLLRQRWLGSCAHAMTDAMLDGDDGPAIAHLQAVAERHARVLDASVPAMLEAAALARARVAALASALNLQVAPGSPAHRLLVNADRSGRADDGRAADPLQATVIMTMTTQATGLGGLAPTAADQLAAGMQDITQAMLAADVDLNAVLRMVLETMYRALGFQRVIFCLRDTRSDVLSGRFGLGVDGSESARHFRVPLTVDAATADLFAAVCHKGVDSLINDTRQAGIAARLPAWYRKHLDAGAFVLLPMALKGAPFALIYADMARAGDIRIDERELSLMRSLRNQAVMAFRQAA